MRVYIAGNMVFDDLIGHYWMFSGNKTALFCFVLRCSVCDIELTSREPFLYPSACWPQQLPHKYAGETELDR